jgi:hypothetical protein
MTTITAERVVDLLSSILSPQQIRVFMKGTTQDKIDLRPILEVCRAFDVLSSILPPKEIRKRIEAMLLFAVTLKRGVLKRRPGRPRRRSQYEILRSEVHWEDMEDSDELVIQKAVVAYLGASEAANEELEATVRLQRMFQGRPSNKEDNQELLEGWLAAESRGMTKRAFTKLVRKGYGPEATDDDGRNVERKLNRLLKKQFSD